VGGSEPRDPSSIDGGTTTAAEPAALHAAALEVGSSLDRYVVLELVGAGGMGEVYAAFDRKLDRKIALKVMRRRDPLQAARMMREAQAMARLSHANVVAVFDTGTVEGGRVFLAMEFVPGTTARDWQRASARSWHDVLHVYLEAGKGLAAAHAAGLVHRDFKPANVLVADDGSVKVTDFGLARAVGEPRASAEARVDSDPSLPAPPQSGAALDAPMTLEGTTMGTPGYMPPEQHLGLVADERSDQFAFCVALHEALYGRRPFDGDTPQDLVEAKVAGRVVEAPRGTRVPARIRQALLRGLGADRATRYPSMRALLDDLARDPSQRRRRIVVAGAAVAALVASGLWLRHAADAGRSQLCTGAESESAEVWNAGVQQNIERSLLATGVPYAADTWRRTRDQVEGYMARWRAMHKDTCEATRLRGEQSETILGARMACLEQRRREVQALTQVLGAADREVASKAVQASTELTSLDVCRNVTSLMAIEPEPTDAARSAELESIRRSTAALKANFDAGRYAAVRDQAAPIVAQAQRLGYEPAIADVLLLSAKARAESGAPSDALADAEQAALAADAGRDDAVRLQAEARLALWSQDTGRGQDSARWSRAAEATARRVGTDDGAMADWLSLLGTMRVREGRYDDATKPLRDALDAARRAGWSAEHTADVARPLVNLYAQTGRYADAQQLLDELDRDLVRADGVEHPSRIKVLTARSYVAGQSNDVPHELEYSEAAIALGDRVAPDHDRLPAASLNACDARVRLHDYDAAVAACDRAVATSRRIHGASGYLALAYVTLGDALMGLGRNDDAALADEEAIRVLTDIRKDAAAPEGMVWAVSLEGLGTARLRQGRAADARPMLEQSLELLDRVYSPSAEDDMQVGKTCFSLAQALWGTGVHTARVADLARRSAESYRRADAEAEAREVEGWAATRKGPG
jgi:tetratricopeptide (TPR) repeat protein